LHEQISQTFFVLSSGNPAGLGSDIPKGAMSEITAGLHAESRQWRHDDIIHDIFLAYW